MYNAKIILFVICFSVFNVSVCIFCIGIQFRALSKKIDSMLKIFNAQQKTLELLGKGQKLQLDRSDLEIKTGVTILESFVSLAQFLAEQRNYRSDQGK